MRRVCVFIVAICAVMMTACIERKIPSGADEEFVSILKAAEKGDADSMFQVAYYLANGQHVAQNLAASWKWFNKAAEMNHADAMNCIGVSYRDGIYVEQDYKKAKDWLLKGLEADRFNHVILANLAWTYAVGFHDFRNAHRFADMAVQLEPRNLFALGVKGRICLMQDDLDGVRLYWKKCDKLKPHYIKGNAPFAKAIRAYIDSIKAQNQQQR